VLYLTAAGDGDRVVYFDELYGDDAGVIRALDANDAALVAAFARPSSTCAA
jgi:hypothetical protein